MKKLIALFLFCIYGVSSFACTTFLLNDDGHFYFGRNYDWITGNGMVMINARNVKKSSASDGSSLNWTSKYGSITFNQYGKEFPTGGMNEKGLVVELMWLDETVYPKADGRPAVGVLQWLQYQLDNCQNIDEVINSDKIIRIGQSNTPLHYLIADASGKAGTIEFLNGKMTVHKGDALTTPVLTNSTYTESVEKTKQAISQNKTESLPDNSLQRFAKACSMINTFSSNKKETNALDYSFSILEKVAQGNYTKWSIVYDITAKKIYFVTNKNKTRQTITFSDFDFNCQSSSLSLDMNEAASGKFIPLSYEINKKLVETSVKESSSIITIPDEAVKETVEFYKKVNCATN